MSGDANTQLQRAVALHSQGLPTEAALLYAEVLRHDPDHPDALHLMGVTETQLGRPRSGLEWIRRSLAINPDQPGAIANQGNAFLALKESEQALACYDEALRHWPSYSVALYGRGNALSSLGKPAEALSSFERALALTPTFLEALLARAGVLRKLDRYEDALAVYDEAIALSPGLAQPHIERAATQLALKAHDEAMSSIDNALQLAPRSAEAFALRGQALAELDRKGEALEAYQQALRLDPAHAELWFNFGVTLSSQGQYSEAASALRRALQLDPELPYARGAALHADLRVCNWSGYMEAVAAISSGVDREQPVDFPFSFLAVCDSPPRQRRCAQRFAGLHGRNAQPLSTDGPTDRSKIRIAYVSADFLEHPTSYLMAGVFEKHDRERFEITGISLRDQAGSPTAQRVRAAFDRTISAESLSDAALARLLRQLHIDIAVDLMGYTGSHRAGMFAHRPAPIQVNYLGFPGTMGSPNIDYLIADDFLIAESARAGYSENIAYLPHCFQANDDRRPSVMQMPTRAQMDLPEAGLVMCSFHSSYKLNPPLFDIWSRLVLAVPGSVLWLVGGDETMEQNLRKEALNRGLQPERLIFAKQLPYPEHLARLRLADLCLDTLPFNGGTTSSDALWAGVPVVTCSGESFAGRMSGSLLHALGMPELVTASLEDYERLALELGSNPKRLAQIRAFLARQRNTAPLFETDRFRRHLETAYAIMIERHRSGLAPCDFRVPGP